MWTGRCRRCAPRRDRRLGGCVRPGKAPHGERGGLQRHLRGPDAGCARAASAWSQDSVGHGSSRQRGPVLDRSSRVDAGRAGKLQLFDCRRCAPKSARSRRSREAVRKRARQADRRREGARCGQTEADTEQPIAPPAWPSYGTHLPLRNLCVLRTVCAVVSRFCGRHRLGTLRGQGYLGSAFRA